MPTPNGPGGRNSPALRAWLAPFLLACPLLPGCATPSTPAQATLPPQWRAPARNGWSPQANALRDQGLLQPLFYTPEMAAWAAFARDNLQDGDLLFRFGLSNTVLGKLSSALVASFSDSTFSHDALVVREGDRVLVYDAQPEGIRKIPFEFWALDVAEGTLAIKRLKEPYRFAIGAALAYCEDAYQRQVPFDTYLKPDDEKLYCSEMIEKGFASGGLYLSRPVPIRCLPHYLRYSPLKPLAYLFTDFDVNDPIWVPGNECYGAYASPYLETIYRGEKVHRGRRGHTCPRCEACGPP